MVRGQVPRFTVLDECDCVLDSLISETNWTKHLRRLGYPLLNQWTEQKFVGDDITRSTVPHAWLWPITVADAVASRVDLIVSENEKQHTLDWSMFPSTMRLREIRKHLKQDRRKVRLHVRDISVQH